MNEKANDRDQITIEVMETWPELVNMDRASVILSMPVRTLNTLANKGTVPAVKIGKRWKFPRRKLMAMAGLE